MNADDLAVVVFAFHEAENVPAVLGEIHRWLRSRSAVAELVFVDDGSTDATLARAREVLAGDAHAAAFSLGANRGIGGALKAGVATSTRPWVTFLPADGQIPPEELDVLLAAAADDDVDVVFSVYRGRDDGLHRKAMSAGVRGLIRAVHGVEMRSDGPYLFRRELFHPRQLAPDSFFLNFEFPIRAARLGLRTREVTITCVPRRAGQSKSAGWRTIYRVGRDLLALKARLWRER